MGRALSLLPVVIGVAFMIYVVDSLGSIRRKQLWSANTLRDIEMRKQPLDDRLNAVQLTRALREAV